MEESREMKVKRRVLSLLLAVLLITALAQLPVLAAIPEDASGTESVQVPRVNPGKGDVYVGETKVSGKPGTQYWVGDGKGGLTAVGATQSNFNVSYNNAERVLTLRNAQITTGVNYADTPLTRVASVYSAGDLTIALQGSSTITVPGAAGFDGSVGITTEYGDLTLTGQDRDRLTINAGTGEYSAALTRVGALYLESADVEANGGGGSEIAVSVGCSAKNLVMYDSVLNAAGGSLTMDRDNAAAESYGLLCGDVDMQLSSLEGRGGDVLSLGQAAGGVSVGMRLGVDADGAVYPGVSGSQSVSCQSGDVNAPFGQGMSYGLWLDAGVSFTASGASTLDTFAGLVSAQEGGGVSYGVYGAGGNTVEIHAGSFGASGETLALSPEVTLNWRGAADQVNLTDSRSGMYSGANLLPLSEQNLHNNLPDLSVTQFLSLAQLRPVARSFELTLPAPQAGTLLSADAASGGDDRYSVRVEWRDWDSGADVIGTRAQAGRTYEAAIVLRAAQDVSGLPNVWLIPDSLDGVKVNGLTVHDNDTVRWFPNDGTVLEAKIDFTVPGGTQPPAFVEPFTDVPADAWYASWVRGAYEKGLIAGMTPTTFVPDGSMTYAQAITLAARMCLLYYTGEAPMENGTVNWYDPYVEFCFEHGIIRSTYEDCINDNIDRQTYADIFSRALPPEALAPRNEIPDGSIPDVPADSEYYDSIYLLYRAGILNGSQSDGTFDPNTDIKRSEVAAVLNRMMDPAVRVDAPADLAVG